MKSERHALILSLIEKKNVETQEDLAELLKERGVAVTQATVSRDIKELRLIKVLSETGGYKYATVDKAEAGMKERFVRIFSDSVISITASANLIILKTLAGSANAERRRWTRCIGTILPERWPAITPFYRGKNEKAVPEIMERLGMMIKKIGKEQKCFRVYTWKILHLSRSWGLSFSPASMF